jgi:hypothetical protein
MVLPMDLDPLRPTELSRLSACLTTQAIEFEINFNRSLNDSSKGTLIRFK